MADLVSHPDEIRVVSQRFGKGAANIERYLELDGYKAVQKALQMKPEEIINEVKISNLRGRGGAGFPTGMKWGFVPKEAAKPKYVLVNGDESEPGTCKDRLILEHDPHSVIEGVLIAGLAVGARKGYIYIRGEYRYLVDIMRKAIDEAYAKGFCGKNIFGSGIDFDVYWHTGAGAYEVGEESALMESLEGKRGIPRIRPTTWKHSLRSHTSFCRAGRSLPIMDRPRMAERGCSASAAMWKSRAFMSFRSDIR
jgi:NADH-quinone oxidoreductase subunit F